MSFSFPRAPWARVSLLVCAWLGGTSFGAIALVGLDESGKTFVAPLSRAAYQDRLVRLATAAVDATVPVLDSRAPGRHWRLRTFVLGIGAVIDLGIAKILSVEIAPSLNLIFSNSNDPQIP